ncbi:MAG: MBL fold metallo-hydrolase [Myxococcota bacterium]
MLRIGPPFRQTPDRPCDWATARVLFPAALWLLALLGAVLQTGCTASSQPTTLSDLGRRVGVVEFEAALGQPGPIGFERIVAADWVVDRSGLINLDHPEAKKQGIASGPEPIEIFLYVLTHPSRGTWLVDSGVAEVFREEGRAPQVSPIVNAVMATDNLDVHVSTAEWLAAQARPPAGVLLTHIHMDHVMGLPDVPGSVPVFVGRGETRGRAFLNLFTRGTLDRLIARDEALQEFDFVPPSGDEPRSILDVFGDGSLFAIHSPGHTPGSTAFVARTPDGPKLLVGDTCHTAWGWLNGVEPGSFTADHAANAISLAWLRDLAAAHPELEVHLGHQRLPR